MDKYEADSSSPGHEIIRSLWASNIYYEFSTKHTAGGLSLIVCMACSQLLKK
jgi:hypothetical protein